MNDKAKEILDSLRPLFDEARQKGLWFYTGYHDIWFSPNQLADAQDCGKFIWGIPNWTLRDPAERLHELAMARDAAEKAFVLFAKEYSDFVSSRPDHP